MVAPCDKYQHLVVGPDGQTVESPWGMIPTAGDYEDWRGVADRIIGQAESALLALFEKNGALLPEVAEPVEALRLRWQQMGGAIADLLKTFPEMTWGPSIASAVELARDAACQLGIVEAQGVKLDIPQARPATGGKGKGLFLMLGLLAVGYFIGDRER